MTDIPDHSRAAWTHARHRQIIAYHGDGHPVIAYAKETLPDGWRSWALVRSLDGARLVTSHYRRRHGRLMYVGSLDDDILTPRISHALRQPFQDASPLRLLDQVDIEEWLCLFAPPEKRFI